MACAPYGGAPVDRPIADLSRLLWKDAGGLAAGWLFRTALQTLSQPPFHMARRRRPQRQGLFGIAQLPPTRWPEAAAVDLYLSPAVHRVDQEPSRCRHAWRRRTFGSG